MAARVGEPNKAITKYWSLPLKPRGSDLGTETNLRPSLTGSSAIHKSLPRPSCLKNTERSNRYDRFR